MDFGFKPRAEEETYIVRGGMHQAMFTSEAELRQYLDYNGYQIGRRLGFDDKRSSRYNRYEIDRKDGSTAAVLHVMHH